jgi:hypothetical protein
LAFVGIFCVVLLVLTTVIHYEILRLLNAGLPRLVMPPRARLTVVIFGTFVAHAAEIFLYAAGFYLLARYLGYGRLNETMRSSLTLCLYFSAETYTSLGYGDVLPGGDLRLLAGMEALNGLLLIGWSASYTYLAMERFWGDHGSGDPPGAAQSGAAADAPPSARR